MKDKLYFEGKLYIAEDKLYFEVQRDKLYFGDKLYFEGQTLFSRTNFIRTSKWKRGPAVFVPFKMEDKMDVHDLPKETLEKYFYAGFEYKTIVLLLERHHSIKTSVRTLRRVLSNLGLKRRGQSVDIDAVRNHMRAEMEGPGCLKGYRSMWHLLRIKHHIQVPRTYVAHLLHELDPEASRERHRRRLVRRTYSSYGPNFSWHVDGT